MRLRATRLTAIAHAARRVVAGYSPLTLFSAGEQGVWYDPSDMSTMFQDAAGTTPVTAVEQPVGLILDKSKGLVLGPNLSSNPTYETGLGSTVGGNGGAVSWDAINKRAVLNTNSSNYSQIQIANTASPLQAGRTYQISIDITNISCTQGNILLQSSLLLTPYLQSLGSSAWIGQTRTYSIILTAERWPGATWLFCQLNGVNATGEIAVDNISVRELPGFHATQTTATSRPVLSARYNLLTNTEAFDSASWIKLNGVNQPNSLVLPNVEIAPNNTLTADKLVEPLSVSPAVSNARIYVVNVPTTSGISHTFTIHAKAAERKYISIRLDTSGNNFGVLVDLENGNTFTGRYDGTNPSLPFSNLIVSNVGNGWWRISGTCTTAASTGVFIHACATNTTTAYTGDGTSGIYIWGADLRAANDALNKPAYQRVNAATDYDTAGFKPYLRFDGTDDLLQTNSVNFTATDKMTVFAGVRKLSDAATAVLVENGAGTATGAFLLAAPSTSGANSYRFVSGGSITGAGVSGSGTFAVAPDTSVLTGIGDISADVAILRRNGVEQATGTADQGTGNYGNYPLYIGRRAGSTLPFNGRLYGLIVVGSALTAQQITNTENWLNQRTGAF